MASTPTILLAGALLAIAFSGFGLALTRWARLGGALGAGLAPTVGWGVFTALALPIQQFSGLTGASTAILGVLATVAAIASGRLRRPDARAGGALPIWAFGLAALVALLPLAALLPKHGSGGIMLGESASDHVKIAIIDAMTRLGLPAANPFFGASGSRSALSYYYLWHYSAAQISQLARITGWEADAALTGFTAYGSLLLMMGVTVRLHDWMSGGETAAADASDRAGARIAIAGVAVLSLSGPLWPQISRVLGPHGLDGVFAQYRGVETWIDQASWVPQHLASADCVIVAVLLLAGLDAPLGAKAPRVFLSGAVAAAAFGSSAWVGGVTFAMVAAGVGAEVLARTPAERRPGLVVGWLAAAALALGLALPLLRAELGAVALRHDGPPMAFHPYEIVGPWAPPAIRRALDLPAFWLVRLPLDLPAIYPIGVAAGLFGFRESQERGARDPLIAGFALTIAVSLAVSWLFESTIGNNDLGWRAVLPATLLLIPFGAAGFACWWRRRAFVAVGLTLALVAACTPNRLILANVLGQPTDDAKDFADSPAMWAAVRRYAGPQDRVADNPQYLDELTAWAVNPSWAFLSNRSSCFSGWETARAYVDLPRARIKALDDQFVRVFSGEGSQDDVRQMALEYGCRVVVVVADDGAWTRDPFAGSPFYRLAEQSRGWRIYRRAPGTP
jgi:hypothetical protein